MQFKSGVNPEGVHPRLWERLSLANREHIVLVGEPLVVTSMRRQWNPKKKSKHSPPWGSLCTAADIRRYRLDATGRTEHFCRWMQKELGIGVLLEPDWMTREQIASRGGIDKIAPHVHVQLRTDPSDFVFGWVD